jgi:hypothetical protein
MQSSTLPKDHRTAGNTVSPKHDTTEMAPDRFKNFWKD